MSRGDGRGRLTAAASLSRRLVRFPKRVTRLLLLVGALGLLAGGGILTALWVQDAWAPALPRPTGPYAVGRVAYDWMAGRDPERPAGHPPGRLTPGVWVWYPAAPGQRGRVPTVPLASRSRWAIRPQLEPPPPTPAQRLAAVRVHAIPHARPATARATYPVLVLLPGWGQPVTHYSALGEELASHGYVVAGVTPPLRAGTAEQLFAAWADVAIFVLDELERVSRADPLGTLTGRVDLSSAGILGHSLGGAVAVEACRRDRRLLAGVDIDGYPPLPGEGPVLDRPFMFIWSEVADLLRDPRLRALRDTGAVQRRLGRDGYQLVVRGMRHFSFSDYAVLEAPEVKTQVALGSIDGQRGLAITREYLRAFFDRYLKGSDEPLLEGSPARYPEVYLHRGERWGAAWERERPLRSAPAG